MRENKCHLPCNLIFGGHFNRNLRVNIFLVGANIFLLSCFLIPQKKYIFIVKYMALALTNDGGRPD